MTSLRPVRFLLVVAFTLLSGSGVNAQNSATDCKARSLNPGCSTAQTDSTFPDLPKVTYLDGQLTITARNASLGDVLRAVSTLTGAVIEFPADRAGERLFAQAGPGPVRDVLASLLTGSRFNYVMLGSPSHPNFLQRMILTNADPPAGTVPPQVSNQTALPVLPVQAATARAESETSEAAVPPVPIPSPLQAENSEKAANSEQMERPKERLSPEVIKQMVQERMAALRQQRQQQSSPPP